MSNSNDFLAGNILGGGFPVVPANSVQLGDNIFTPQNVAITNDNATTFNVFTMAEAFQGQINAITAGAGNVTAVNSLTGAVSMNQSSYGGIGFIVEGETNGNFFLDYSNPGQAGAITTDEDGNLTVIPYTYQSTINTIVSRNNSGNSYFNNAYLANLYVSNSVDVLTPASDLAIGVSAANLNLGDAGVNIYFRNITDAGAIITDNTGKISSLPYSSNTVIFSLVERDEFGNFHGNDIYSDGQFYSGGLDAPSPITLINIGASIATTINIGNTNCTTNFIGNVTGLNFANRSFLPGTNQQISTIPGTNVQIWYDGINQQIYILNNESNSIQYAFNANIVIVSSTSLQFCNGIITLAPSDSGYFSVDGNIDNTYNINTFGNELNINCITFIINGTTYRLLNLNMIFDGTKNYITIQGEE